MAKINLTDRFISSDKRKPPEGQEDYPTLRCRGWRYGSRRPAIGHSS